MKILVTGGAGFIGSHIVDLLVGQGFQILVLDDLSRGKEIHVHREAKFVRQDIRFPEVLGILRAEKVDFVIHQAAQIDVQTSLAEPLLDASVNILGTLNLLEACLKTGVKKVIYASSAAVYGEPRYLPVDERHPLNCQSGYGLSKQVGERYLDLYKELHGLDYTVLRYANVYGPRQDGTGEGGVVAVFVDKLLKGEVPEIFGSGEQTRDFVYVTDVARANLLALTRGSGLCMNVSTGGETSVNELFRLLRKLAGEAGEPKYSGAKQGDILKSYLAPDLIKASLGWEPEMPLFEGLQRTLDYQRGKIRQAGSIKEAG